MEINLNQIEIQILFDIYEMDLNNGELISLKNYDLVEINERERTQEFARYLLKLERLGYIYFEGQAFSTGGQQNRKYRNNVLMIWSDKIHIGNKGIKFVNEAKKTFFEKAIDKTKDLTKDIGKTIYDEAKDFTSKTIAEYLIKLTKGQ